MTDHILRQNIQASIEVHKRVLEACLPSMGVAADALIAAYRNGRKALFFGNGGSAADAQHLAAESPLANHVGRSGNRDHARRRALLHLLLDRIAAVQSFGSPEILVVPDVLANR